MRRALVALFFMALAQTAFAELVEVKGKRLSVFAPEGDQAAAKRLVEEGERALEMYATDIGVEIPANVRFKIFCYPTKEDYEAAEQVRTHGAFKNNLAFTYAKNAEVHMLFQPRPNRGAAPDGPGMLEALAMHELSHALQFKAVKDYGNQPDWLSEGMAYVLSERADSGSESGSVERLPYYAEFALDVEDALELGQLIPLDRLLAEPWGGTGNFRERQIWYGEAWELARFLDSPDAPERREKFRGFLKEIEGYPAGDDGRRVNARFRDIFGKRTKGEGVPSLAAIEREWVASILRSKPFPWHVINRELRVRADGGLVVESLPEAPAFAVSAEARLGPRAQIAANVTIEDGAGRQADIIFAYRGRDEYHKLAFGAAGFVTLMHFNGEWKTVFNAKCPPELLTPGTAHRIEVGIDLGRLSVKIDGKIVMGCVLGEGNFGGGRYGIGAYDSRVVFRDVTGTSF